MNARLFLALWPDETVRAQLASWRDGWHWPSGATPVRRERLHVTLHFLGEVDRAALPGLTEALSVPVDPFVLEFGHATLWHRGLAVLEPLATPPQLAALHARLSAAVTVAGLAVDSRPYRPHVTLARRADNAQLLHPGPTVVWPVAGYALIESSAQEGYVPRVQWPAAALTLPGAPRPA